MRDLIRYYTREAGVRNLEREIANLTRKAIKDILMKKTERVAVTRRNLEKYAGVGGSALARPRARIWSASPPGSPGPRSAASC